MNFIVFILNSFGLLPFLPFQKKLSAFFGQILLNLKFLNRVKYLESSVL